MELPWNINNLTPFLEPRKHLCEFHRDVTGVLLSFYADGEISSDAPSHIDIKISVSYNRKRSLSA